MSILVNKSKAQTSTLSVRIPGSLADDLDALRADAERAGYTLDVSSIVAAALTRAVRDARAELAAAAPSPSPSRKRDAAHADATASAAA